MNNLAANHTKQVSLWAGVLSVRLPWPVATRAQGPAYNGGLSVLNHLPSKIADYLHREHGHIFPSMGLPRKSAPLDRIQVMFIVMY